MDLIFLGRIVSVIDFTTGTAPKTAASKPKNKFVKTTYRAFSALWPLAGKVIAGDSESYRYLVESIRMHPDQETLKTMLEDANFTDCKYYDLLNGVCAIHIGFKPSI